MLKLYIDCIDIALVERKTTEINSFDEGDRIIITLTF